MNILREASTRCQVYSLEAKPLFSHTYTLRAYSIYTEGVCVRVSGIWFLVY